MEIVNKIPQNFVGLVGRSPVCHITVQPKPFIIDGIAYNPRNLSSQLLYTYLIEDKIVLPRGVLHWCQELTLPDRRITHCFTFAKKCTKNVFKQVFQYKIGVNILPTNEYLFRYKVLENNICGRCQDGEEDSIMHGLWECVTIQPFLTIVLRNINTWTGTELDMLDFLFWVG